MRPRQRIRRLSAALRLAAALVPVVGCAVGPDFRAPAAPEAAGYTPEPLVPRTASADVAGGEAQRFVAGMDIPGQWWTLFHSPSLNALVEQALKANPNVEAGKAALLQAMESIYAQEGFYYPTVQANFSPSRQKNAVGTISPTLSSGAPIFNLFTAQVAVSYTLDVFGTNRRQVESLQAQAESQRFQLEATYLTLTSNVVAAAVQEASLRAQITATQAVIKIEAEQLDILRRQFALGAVSMAEVAAQQTTLSQAQATLPPLQKQLALQRDLLTALVGRFPSDEPAEQFDLATMQLPLELPVSLPSKLIEQRPDVRSAVANMHAASAEVGVAIAAELPQFTISALLGTTATAFSKLFTSGTGFWTIAGSATQTMFDGGTLLHKRRAAEAVLDQAAAQYRATVITAFQNVADSLRALQFDADSLAAQVAAERAAAESLEIQRQQLRLGAISYLSLLTAEQAYQQTVINRVQAQANRFADTAALFQALGGGWWNRAD
jgi:NodT family efflux transporter outer membrane factor (OMF) lipoprotein